MLSSVENVIRLIIRNRYAAEISDVVSYLQAQPGVEIVGEVNEHLELLLAVRDKGVNAVLLAMQMDEDDGLLSHLFAEYPDLTVLVVQEQHKVFIEQRCRHRTLVHDLSPPGLAKALRSAVHNPCESVYLGMTH